MGRGAAAADSLCVQWGHTSTAGVVGVLGAGCAGGPGGHTYSRSQRVGVSGWVCEKACSGACVCPVLCSEALGSPPPPHGLGGVASFRVSLLVMCAREMWQGQTQPSPGVVACVCLCARLGVCLFVLGADQ